MVDIFGLRKGRSIRKEKLDSLSKLQDIRETEKEKSLNRRIETLVSRKFDEMGLAENMREMNTKLNDVLDKMQEMALMYEDNCRKNETPTKKKIKMKEMVKLLLRQHGHLTAAELSRKLNLSRTRCSEYLKELEKQEMLESFLDCRKKYYRIRQ